MLLLGLVVMMVMRDAEGGVGDAECSQLWLVMLGREGVEACATLVLWVFLEEHL
jgi:hypothetical protein